MQQNKDPNDIEDSRMRVARTLAKGAYELDQFEQQKNKKDRKGQKRTFRVFVHNKWNVKLFAQSPNKRIYFGVIIVSPQQSKQVEREVNDVLSRDFPVWIDIYKGVFCVVLYLTRKTLISLALIGLALTELPPFVLEIIRAAVQ